MWRVPGNSGGESETIIGEWFAARGRRDDVVLATKVASLPTRKGLAAANIAAACDDSLRRLQTDHIDLYYAHYDDQNVAQEEYLDAFDALVRAGKVRAIAASNFTAERLRSALEISRAGRARRVRRAAAALQPAWSGPIRGLPAAAPAGGGPVVRALLRAGEGLPHRQVPRRRRRGRQPARGRARGLPRRPRAGGARRAGRDRRRRTRCRSRRWRWPGSRRSRRCVAPIASARNTEQLADLLPVLDLKLTDDEVRLLAHVSA